jgi:HSP20 family molecular chaperone IbpA
MGNKISIKDVLIAVLVIAVLAEGYILFRNSRAGQGMKPEKKASIEQIRKAVEVEQKRVNNQFDRMFEDEMKDHNKRMNDIFSEMDRTRKEMDKMMEQTEKGGFVYNFGGGTGGKMENVMSVKSDNNGAEIDLGSKEMADNAKVTVKDGMINIESGYSEGSGKTSKGVTSEASFSSSFYRQISLPGNVDEKKVKIERKGSKIIIKYDYVKK